MRKRIYGYELIMDLYDCDQKIIISKTKLQEYVDKLCKLIKMKKYGKTLIPYFGEKKIYTKGYSLVQLIETSSITGHFSDYWKTAYINIFSCKKFDHQKAKEFTKNFFGAKRIKTRLIIR
ncbi:MAG TPA: S-adenosylmethionine decarboxylase [Candidatus Omnitrophica bacterium]|nr:S-adenosylmethionine decarboxylase [Candidatus Omnitrophota bacterium]